MIERLFNVESSCDGPEYRKPSEKIIQLKQQLCGQLSPQGKELLEQLTDTYLEQSAVLLEVTFTDGFCTAVDLVLDYLEHRITVRFKADPQQTQES